MIIIEIFENLSKEVLLLYEIGNEEVRDLFCIFFKYLF